MNHNRLPSNAAIPTLNYAISLLILHLYVLLNYINTNVVTKIKRVVFFLLYLRYNFDKNFIDNRHRKSTELQQASN